jgi:hypothetical protein
MKQLRIFLCAAVAAQLILSATPAFAQNDKKEKEIPVLLNATGCSSLDGIVGQCLQLYVNVNTLENGLSNIVSRLGSAEAILNYQALYDELEGYVANLKGLVSVGQGFSEKLPGLVDNVKSELKLLMIPRALRNVGICLKAVKLSLEKCFMMVDKIIPDIKVKIQPAAQSNT